MIFHYEDGHINVCTEGTVIFQVLKTVQNYGNDNSEVYIIDQALLYIPPKISLKFQREIIINIPPKMPTVNRKFLEGLHTTLLTLWRRNFLLNFSTYCI